MKITRRMATIGGLSVLAVASLNTTGLAQSVTEGIIKLPDSSIEYFSQGQGEAVVLLPGGSFTVGYMEGLSQALAEAGYRAVRINFRGAGKSIGPGTGVTLHTLAADVAGVIQALNLGPANVAGHAFGNRVARMLAADNPELVRSVVLLAAGGKVAPKPPAQQALVTIFNPAASEPEVMQAMTYLVGKGEDVGKAWQILRPCRAPEAAGIERTAAESTPLSAWWSPAGQQKYLVLQGTDDQAAPPENGELLKQELGARVTLVPFPGAGHLMLVTEPKKAAAAIVAFLK
jgi:pimeloyl-ACP methyl ester carboxylesterase